MKYMRLIGIVFLVLIAGCKSKGTALLNAERVAESRAIIESSISDPERRSTMLEIVDAMEAQMTDVGAEVRALRQQIVEANRNYATTRADLELLYDELGKRVILLTTTVKDHSLKLRAQCSASEWTQLVDTKTETFNFSF